MVWEYFYILFKRSIRSLLILAILLNTDLSWGQIANQQRTEINELFTTWNLEHHPGGVVGVMTGDEIIYLESYGLASLEYNVPITKETLFNIGSISKQFTAMGIVLLHQRGLLSLDDPVKKYFPGMPIFQYPITIRNLLHHTSGLRDFHDLLALAGWRGDDFRTNQDIMRLMEAQVDLNFQPGETFLYSNTGYVVLAEIIENVTQEELKTWMGNNIFRPLEMNTTYVEDNYQRVVPNNATSYYHSHDVVYERAEGYWAYTGAGNVYSSAEDLLKWSKNFYAPKKHWEAAFKMLQTMQPLKNGDTNNYALGFFIDEKFGSKRIQHAGVVGGFRSFMCIYPEEELSIVVLTNFSNAPFGEKADKLAKIVLAYPELEDKSNNQTAPEKEQSKDPINSSDLKTYTGTFFSSELETHYTIYKYGDRLKWHHARHGDFDLEIINKDKLKGNWPFINVRYSRDENRKINGIWVSNERVKNLWFKKIQCINP